LGKRGVGQLLGMGPERNLGGNHMVYLSHLYSLSASRLIVATHRHSIAGSRFRVSASLLVGYQLSACCAKHEYAHLQFGVNNTENFKKYSSLSCCIVAFFMDFSSLDLITLPLFI
jgi:hypothetical protein